MNQMTLRLDVRDWTMTPGGRYRRNGPHSGEAFRDFLLDPMFREAMDKGILLEVDLEGTLYGALPYATSFLEEAFGGLARIHGVDKVYTYLRVQCADDPQLVDYIHSYIEECHVSNHGGHEWRG